MSEPRGNQDIEALRRYLLDIHFDTEDEAVEALQALERLTKERDEAREALAHIYRFGKSNSIVGNHAWASDIASAALSTEETP